MLHSVLPRQIPRHLLFSITKPWESEFGNWRSVLAIQLHGSYKWVFYFFNWSRAIVIFTVSKNHLNSNTLATTSNQNRRFEKQSRQGVYVGISGLCLHYTSHPSHHVVPFALWSARQAAPVGGLTVGTVLLGIEALVRCAAGVISPAHTTGVFHSIGSQHIVTPHSLWDPWGHVSFMKDKTTGAKSQTFSRRVESFTNTGELTNIYWIPSMCTARLSTTLPSKGGDLRMANIPCPLWRFYTTVLHWAQN